MSHPHLSRILVPILVLGAARCATTSSESEPAAATPDPGPAGVLARNLGGTSWQLVRFEGGDGTVLTPDDKSKYTITFGTDGRLSARIDCNRGTGTWTSPGPPKLTLGPLALTRAQCPPGSLHDQNVRQWTYVRSYVMRGGNLFLSLMADGGIYEFEPMSGATGTQAAVTGTATYRERIALPPGAVLEVTLEDVSRAGAPAEAIGSVRSWLAVRSG